jgi:hypothetical protein
LILASHADVAQIHGRIEFFSLGTVLAADMFVVVFSIVNDVASKAVLTLDVWIYMAGVLKFASWTNGAVEW